LTSRSIYLLLSDTPHLSPFPEQARFFFFSVLYVLMGYGLFFLSFFFIQQAFQIPPFFAHPVQSISYRVSPHTPLLVVLRIRDGSEPIFSIWACRRLFCFFTSFQMSSLAICLSFPVGLLWGEWILVGVISFFLLLLLAPWGWDGLAATDNTPLHFVTWLVFAVF